MSWVKDYKSRVAELERYASALEAREKTLLDALEEVSQGYIPSDWKGSIASGIQRLAAKRLKEVALMIRPRRPYL